MRALNCNVKIEKIPFPLLSLLLFLWKNHHFLIHVFQNSFQDVVLYRLKCQNFSDYNGSLTNMKKKESLPYCCLHDTVAKNFMNIRMYSIVSKIKSSIFLLVKWQSSNIMQSFNWKASFIIVFTMLFLKTLWKNYHQFLIKMFMAPFNIYYIFENFWY